MDYYQQKNLKATIEVDMSIKAFMNAYKKKIAELKQGGEMPLTGINYIMNLNQFYIY